MALGVRYCTHYTSTKILIYKSSKCSPRKKKRDQLNKQEHNITLNNKLISNNKSPLHFHFTLYKKNARK